MTIYRLVSENLTGLGGPMGTERTSENWTKYFGTATYAKATAEKDYGSSIAWLREGKGWHSPDLGYVMYHVQPIKVFIRAKRKGRPYDDAKR